MEHCENLGGRGWACALQTLSALRSLHSDEEDGDEGAQLPVPLVPATPHMKLHDSRTFL